MRSHSCSESTQKTVRKMLKHRKTDLFIFAAFRNLCLKCTYCFSFPLSQTKGHSLNCLSTVIAQTTVRKHKFQHLKHKKPQKRCLPKLNSNLTLSLGDKRDTCQQNSSAFHKPAKNLASVFSPASCPVPWQGSINHPIPGQQGLLAPHYLSLWGHDSKLGENLGQDLQDSWSALVKLCASDNSPVLFFFMF